MAKISVTDSTGGTPSIAARAGREEILIRNAGASTVWMNRNANAVDSGCFYLESGDVIILTAPMSEAAWYMVCASTETATVHTVEE